MRVLWIRDILICFALCWLPTDACIAQVDPNAPDTVRFTGGQAISYNCMFGIKAEIPIYLASDYFYNQVRFWVTWTGAAVLDSVIPLNVWAGPNTFTGVYPESGGRARVDFVGTWEHFGPATDEFARLVFYFDASEALNVRVECDSMILSNMFFEFWRPTVCELETPVVISLPSIPANGDVDLSGIATVSDAVFLIAYIFGGGCEPILQDLADVNHDCLINISDVVYLINYIFGGGPAPQTGCVL